MRTRVSIAESRPANVTRRQASLLCATTTPDECGVAQSRGICSASLEEAVAKHYERYQIQTRCEIEKGLLWPADGKTTEAGHYRTIDASV
jgi:hypothetical protein